MERFVRSNLNEELGLRQLTQLVWNGTAQVYFPWSFLLPPPGEGDKSSLQHSCQNTQVHLLVNTSMLHCFCRGTRERERERERNERLYGNCCCTST